MTDSRVDWPGSTAPGEPNTLALLAEQNTRWERGERVLVEVYLAQQPGLHADAEGLLDLIGNEVHLRQRAGESPQLDEYVKRFPHLASQLADRFKSESDSQESKSFLGASFAGLLPCGEMAAPIVPGYEILGVLGRGGMGVVYKARHRHLNRTVALKMILTGHLAGPEERLRFLAEAEVIASIEHPGIVQVFDFGTHAGLPYFSLEFCPGGSLGKRLANTPQPPLEAAKIIEQLARAVQAAHDRGIVHRDLKPGNVLLAEDGSPRITDFGLAKRIEGGPGLTTTGAVMGTPSYMAPEQAQGKKDVGRLADVYSLGAILYDCLTGRPPFKSTSVPDTLLQVVNDEPLPPRKLIPHVPRDLEAICLKCLNKEPAQRYPGARELAEDLERFLQGKPVNARPVLGFARAWRRIIRKPVLAAGFLILAISLASGLMATRRNVQEPRTPEAPVPEPEPTWRLVEPLPNTFRGPLAEELQPLRKMVLGVEAPVGGRVLDQIAAVRQKTGYDPPDVHYFTYLLEPSSRLQNPPRRLRWAKELQVCVSIYLVTLEGGKRGEFDRLPCSLDKPGEMDIPIHAGTVCRIVAFVFPLNEEAYTNLRQHGFTAKLVKGK